MSAQAGDVAGRVVATAVPSRNIENVQALRALAAGLVVIQHCLDQFADHPIAGMTVIRDSAHLFWGTGVDIFFIISGFIMLQISGQDFAKPGRSARFLQRRLLRIVPLYWTATTMMFVMSFVLPGAVNHGVNGWWHGVASYLFIPAANSTGVVHPVLGLGWTLNYEMFFYCVFALALFLPRKAGLLGLAGLFMAMAALHPLLHGEPFEFWSNPIILEFLAGIGLAIAREHIRLPNLAALAVFAGGVVLFFLAPLLPGAPRIIVGGVPALFMTAPLILSGDRRWAPFALFLGNASYSIYLMHPFGINALTFIWTKAHLPLVAPLYFFALASVSLLIGSACYLVFERPVQRFVARRSAARRAPVVGHAEPLSRPAG